MNNNYKNYKVNVKNNMYLYHDDLKKETIFV